MEKSWWMLYTQRRANVDAMNVVNEDGIIPYSRRRSSIQAAEIRFENGTLGANRDMPFDFWLPDK